MKRTWHQWLAFFVVAFSMLVVNYALFGVERATLLEQTSPPTEVRALGAFGIVETRMAIDGSSYSQDVHTGKLLAAIALSLLHLAICLVICWHVGKRKTIQNVTTLDSGQPPITEIAER